MKMDAMQKRRMWKVAFRHFASTIIFVFIAMLQPAIAFSGNAERARLFQEQLFWHNLWERFLMSIGFLLQPQFWFFEKIPSLNLPVSLLGISTGWIFVPLMLISIPVWSICFAWIFIRTKDWLNHFPVIGRKVF
jgi:hypothetical protein